MLKYVIVILFISFKLNSFSQHENYEYFPETDSLVLEKLDKWQDIKFGLLMHWGAYSQWGIVESWSICAEDEGWCRRKNNNDYTSYKSEYEKLIETFNPIKFNPDKWADAAKNAGMKYVVFTTKHHDGFCMFDSKFTDYKITAKNCPFHTNPKANIAKEIFDAFRKNDFLVGAYFSKPDWHSNDYWWSNFATHDRNVNYDPEVYPEKWNNFVEFTHNQILELMTDYGKMDILWLDGGWVTKYDKKSIENFYHEKLKNSKSGFLKSGIVNQDIRMDELMKKCREKQPGLIVVDRAVPGKNQNYLTPENKVPEKMLPYPWESCIISGEGWSYTPNAKYFSGRRTVQMLVDVVAKGGNLLLNIAPSPEGEWQQGAYNMLNEVGEWMNINSKAIYETRPLAPYKEKNICLTQKNDGTIFFHYLAGKDEKTIPSEISIESVNLKKETKLKILGTNKKLKWVRSEKGFTVFVPKKIRKNPPCKDVWVIKAY